MKMYRPYLGSIFMWCSKWSAVWYVALGGTATAAVASPGPTISWRNAQICFARSMEWLERTTESIPLLPRLAQTQRGPQRDHNQGRSLLLQQDIRSAKEEWEGASRLEEIMDKLNEGQPQEEVPHPLRTQDWKLDIRVSPWKRQEQEVAFYRNGTVWTSDGDAGEWWFDIGGLFWDVNTTVRATPTVFHHKAELHWNAFGSQPRMFRGTVTRDRLSTSLLPPWLFRPVVGSFVGAGIGNDTADPSHRHRQVATSGESDAMPARVTPQTDRY